MGYGHGPYGHGAYGGTPLPGGEAYPYELPPWTAPTATLPTPQAALDARYTTPAGACYIGGMLTPYLSYTVQHRVGETATGRITVPLPRPAQVVANAEVVIQGGHNDLVGPAFAGAIPAWTSAMTQRGDTLEIDLVGWSRVLTEPYRDDVRYHGPIDAGAVFADVCERSAVPSYIAHAALFADGQPLTLGGNSNVDDGMVGIDANSSPLGQAQRLVRPYAYHITDTPSGAVTLHRVLGIPSGSPVVTFTEGVHLGDTRRRYDSAGIVNAPDVRGVTYTDVFGGQVPIRSIADPESVPPHPAIRGGYRTRVTNNSDIVRPDQADAARHVIEINTAEADTPVTFEAVWVPFVAPGDVVKVEASTVEASGLYWLMGIDVTDAPERPLTATYEVWAGAGEEKPGIVDRRTEVIQTAPVHIGDETVPHYAVPVPVGTEKTWAFSLPERVTVANVRGWCHSFNSQTVAGVDTELTVTRWEVWEAGVDRDDDANSPVSSGTMPVQAERYSSGISFVPFATAAGRQPGDDGYVTDPGEWVPFAVNLRTLDAGDYVLVLTAGEKEGYDDGEARGIYLELYGLTRAAGG